jgi:hypothetical protein
LDSLLLEVLKASRLSSSLEKWAMDARGGVLRAAVGAYYIVMFAVGILTGSCVQAVVGGEVVPSALIAARGPGAAGVRSVAPFEAVCTLSGSGGDRPGQAPPNGAHESD